MLSKSKIIPAFAAVLALTAYAGYACADTAITQTTTETPSGATIVKKTVTETTPDTSSVSTTVTATQPAVTETHTKWTTEEHSITPDGARVINLRDFDLNHDGILSRSEVGERLFKLYDTDGNQVIDNIEYERKAVLTVLPMEKETVISYDFDGDGKADEVKRTYETFMQDTMLTRFDKNHDGLSPHEFMGRYFLEADVNHDKAIDLKEWQGSYNAVIDKANKENARFNK